MLPVVELLKIILLNYIKWNEMKKKWLVGYNFLL